MNTSRFFLVLALFSVTVVTHFTMFPFVVGKVVFFRTAVELALLFFLLGCLRYYYGEKVKDQRGGFGNLSLLKSPIVAAVTIFVIIFSLAGFVGYDWQTSFWSNLVRGEGIFQMGHYYVFFLLLIILGGEEKFWNKALVCSLLTGLLTIVLGIIPWQQNFNIDPRFKGAIGNPAFTAAYLLFSLFYLLYLFDLVGATKYEMIRQGLRLSSAECPHHKLSTNIRKLIVFFLYFSSWFLILFFFLATGTRGAFLGLIGAVIVGVAYFFLKKTSMRRRLYFGIAAIVTMCLLAILFYWQPLRIFKISLKEQTAQTRFWTWGSALKGWRERPLLGWGPENFSAVFDKYFDKRHYLGPDKFSEVWFDRAHNIFIDYLVSMGAVGLLSYLAIWLVFYIKFFKTSFEKKFFHQVGFLVLPVAYFIQGSLVFETLPVYVNLFLFLALANFNFQTRILNLKCQNSTPDYYEKLFVTVFSGAGVLLLLAAFYFGSYLPFRKSVLFISSLKNIDQVSSVEEFKNGFSLALDFYAPYGQDEQLKMLGGVIMDLLIKKPSLEVAKSLADYLNQAYDPVLSRGQGNLFAQNYYILGKVNELAGDNAMAGRYYELGRQQWPERPEFVEGLNKLQPPARY